MSCLYQLLNKLFGWDYVTYSFGYSMSTGRVKKIGELYFVHECCNGFMPIHTQSKEMFPLTFTFDRMDEMIRANKAVMARRDK